MTPLTPADVDPAHVDAVRRRRRIIAHCDANLPGELLGIDLTEWLDYRFEYLDAAGSCVDTVVWDMGQIEAEEPVRIMRSGVWTEQGIDVLDALVAESRRRGKEVFWSHRISEVDLTPDGTLALDPQAANPAKAGHPERVVRCWWWQGLWNLCSDWVKAHKVAVLRDLLRRYAFDGLQRLLALRAVPASWPGVGAPPARHRVPRHGARHAAGGGGPARQSAPAGREGAQERGRLPVRRIRRGGLGRSGAGRPDRARLPQSGRRRAGVRGAGRRPGRARVSLPGRSPRHRRLSQPRPGAVPRGVRQLAEPRGGRRADLQLDARLGGHPRSARGAEPAGRAVAPGAVSRGRIARNAAPARSAARGRAPRRLPVDRRLLLLESRRGAARGIAPLGGAGGDPVAHPRGSDRPALGVTRGALRIVLFNAQQGDRYRVAVNGGELTLTDSNYRFRDAQIYSPDPQPPVGWEPIVDRPDQRLARLVYALPAQHLVVGRNRVTVVIEARMPYVTDRAQVEKLEALVTAPAR